MKKFITIFASFFALQLAMHNIAAAANFQPVGYQQIKSPELKRTLVQLKHVHKAIQEDQGFYDNTFRSAVFKARWQKGQNYQSALRQFVRYISYWRATKLDVQLEREVRFNSFIDALFPVFGDEDMSESVFNLVEHFHVRVARIAANPAIDYVEFFFVQRPDPKTFMKSADGWLMVDRRTGEIIVSFVGESDL